MRHQKSLPSALAVALLCLLSLLSSSTACTDLILNLQNQVPGKPAIKAVVSARHLDWYPADSMPLSVVSVPAGTHLDALPASAASSADGCGPKTNSSSSSKANSSSTSSSSSSGSRRRQSLLKASYGFVCTSFGKQVLLDAMKKTCPQLSLQKWPMFCFDGMNTAGLSVGAQVFRSGPRPSTQFVDDDKANFIWHEIPHIILGNYGSADEVSAAFKAGTMRFGSSALLDAAAKTMMGGTDAPMVHFIVHDSAGATLVIEPTKAADGSVEWKPKDNPTGVTTNAPELEQQLQYVKNFKANVAKKNGSVDDDSPASRRFGIVLPGYCADDSGLNAPGAVYCDSVSRFANLALIKEATFGYYPNTNYALNPHRSSDPSHPAYSAVIALISRVYVPGSWPGPVNARVGPAAYPAEATILQVMRDHRKGLLFLRHYGSMQWVQLPVAQLASIKAATGLATADLADIAPPSMPWAQNKAAAFAAAAARAA